MGATMKKKILIATGAALAAVIVLSDTTAATAQQLQQVPQYQAGGFPISPHQMLVLQPSARLTEQQRLSKQPTMDASKHVYPEPGLAQTGY